MTGLSETVDRCEEALPKPVDLMKWLRLRAAACIGVAIMAAALGCGYVFAATFARTLERDLAGQSLRAVERMTTATRDAVPVLSPLVGQPCAAVLEQLRRKSSLVLYLRSAVLVQGDRGVCSSRLGVVDYSLSSMFPERVKTQALGLIAGSVYQPGKPLFTLYRPIGAGQAILFLIDAAYLRDALGPATVGGAQGASVSVQGSGTLSESGQYSREGRAALSSAGTTVTGEDGALSVSVRLSARKKAGILALGELAFGALGALVAAMAAAAYAGALSPERRLLRAVAAGLANNEFFLVYQPLVEVATRQWIGAEALLRWNHPKLGPLTPQAFIEQIEGSMLIEDATRFVLRRALEDMAVIGVPPNWHLAVNVTPRSICTPGFAMHIAAMVRDSGTVCTVTVEVTERQLLGYDRAAITAFNALHRGGVSVAVDDFGTENSNIDLLSRYDFDYLKIDRQYTARLGTHKSALVEGICALAGHLHATVVAEGVETQAQHQALNRMGVTIAQGYLYQKPVPAEEFARLYIAQRQPSQLACPNLPEYLHGHQYEPRRLYGQRAAAATVAAMTVLIAWVAGSFSATPLPVVAAFLPMFAAAIILTEGQTAYLLVKQFQTTGDAFLGALSGAYSFTAVAATVQILIFPGVFSPTGLLGAGPHSAVWIWMFWHTGFPACVAAAMALRFCTEHLPHVNARRCAKWLAFGAPALAGVLCFVAAYSGGFLPSIVSGNSYATLSHSPVATAVLASNLIALGACLGVGRLRQSIDVWLTVAIVASIADVALTLSGGARYTLGWYVARVLSIVSSGVVLCMLIGEITRLHRGLLAANAALAAQAYRDALTGIANRQSFNDRWQMEQARALRVASELSVLMLDIDHFKRINDTFGHKEGDACLAAVANVLKTVMQRRASDFVARYGGEEFVVLLPHTDAEGAAHCAETIRQAILTLNWPAPEQSGGRVTVSIGHATYAPACVTAGRGEPAAAMLEAAATLQRADEALYEAKRSGRNRVVASFHPAPVRGGTAVPSRQRPDHTGRFSGVVHSASRLAIFQS